MAIGKWTEKEIQYITDNRLEKSYVEMGKCLGRTRNAVMVKLNRMGLKLPKKYVFNHDFFENIDSEEKAYWLGFAYADGYIASDTEFSIHLKASDASHLKKFNRSLSGNIGVLEFEKTLNVNNKTYKMASIRIYSKKIVGDLYNKGLKKNKSLVIKFPGEEIIPSIFMSSFIRGFFDGNGSIYFHKERNQIRCKFTCASPDFAHFLSWFLSSFEIKTYISDKTKKNKSYNLGITGKSSTRKFLEYIYDDASIYLDRKYRFYQNNKDLLIYKYNAWNNK